MRLSCASLMLQTFVQITLNTQVSVTSSGDDDMTYDGG